MMAASTSSGGPCSSRSICNRCREPRVRARDLAEPAGDVVSAVQAVCGFGIQQDEGTGGANTSRREAGERY
jgi:hypothetical protein